MRKGLLALAVMVGATGLLGMGRRDQDAPIPDTALGLSKTSVFDTPAPPPTEANRSEPGDLPLEPASFPQQPPAIPHGIDDYVPITAADNACVECHTVPERVAGEPTPIPRSHYVDLRNAPDVERPKIAGARYLCLSCHVTPGRNALLVGNTFGR